MTARFFVTLLAVAGLAAPAAAGAETSRFDLAQAATPLPIPAENATSGSDAAAPAAATPPAAATTTTTTTTPVPPAVPTPPDTLKLPETPPAAAAPDGSATTPGAGQTDGASPDDGAAGSDDGDSPDSEPLSLGEIPTIETMELTPDIAKRALDSYIIAKEKYADTDLDQYENLQDFVDQTDDGKKFEADVKAAGFPNVTDWNLAVTTLGLTYSTILDDQSDDLLVQIKEVEDDKELAQDMKDKMIKALKALIPSENNKKVIQDLMNDPVYGPKLKQIDVEEE